MSDGNEFARLRGLVAAAQTPQGCDIADYRIATALGAAFLGRARSGKIALLVPLAAMVSAVGRSGGGFTLTSVPRVVFEYEGRQWEQAGAVLECTDDTLRDAFLVLVDDIARRLPNTATEVTWPTVLACVDEWQALFARRPRLTPEQQLGLWGELWVISQAVDPDQIIAAWRGPSGEPVDFFYDGVALEVKVCRRAHVHHVSQSQVHKPRGDHESYLLSIWVGTEPVRGISLGELVQQMLLRSGDPAAFLKLLMLAGYSPQDHSEYAERFILLEAASWFRTVDVPTVDRVDEGVSNLRYVVTLDMSRCLNDSRTQELWQHFGCAALGGTRDLGDHA